MACSEVKATVPGLHGTGKTGIPPVLPSHGAQHQANTKHFPEPLSADCLLLTERVPHISNADSEGKKTPKLTDRAVNLGQFSCLKQQQDWLSLSPIVLKGQN